MTDAAKIGMIFATCIIAGGIMDVVDQMNYEKKKTRKRKPAEVKDKKKSPIDEFITDLVENPKTGQWERPKPQKV